MGSEAAETLNQLSPDECTAKCSTLPDCRSVNYCPKSARSPDSTCAIMKKSLKDPSVSRIRDPGCWNYRRLSADTFPPPPPPPPPPPAGNTVTGYTGARLTWLVIGMIVTGAVVGMAALLAYGSWKARSGRTANGSLGLAIPSVRWSRQRDEE